MDSPDWFKLKELEEENGHGCIQFEFEGSTLRVEEITFVEDENAIVVQLS